MEGVAAEPAGAERGGIGAQRGDIILIHGFLVVRAPLGARDRSQG
jgi:hypothetical protein